MCESVITVHSITELKYLLEEPGTIINLIGEGGDNDDQEESVSPETGVGPVENGTPAIFQSADSFAD